VKILVTGGSGFIGSNLIAELIKKHEVIAFDNGFRAGFENILSNSNVTLVKGDVTKKEDWAKLPTDVDFVYHLAAINGTKFFYEIPSKVLEVNVRGTLNFVEWIKDTNAKQFFFASSSEVYGFPKIFPTPETEPLTVPDPINPRFSYSSSKIIGETIAINFAKSYGIDFTIGRFHNVYGPKMGFEHVIPEFIRKCVKKEKFTVQGDGNEARCFCYISDAINALTLLMNSTDSKNKIYNIGTNEEIKINDIISILENIHNQSISPTYEEFKNAGTKRRVPDISKITKLGFIPEISFKDGLKLSYDWYSAHYLSN
tara:strand:- start:9527 stop:10465 length:939 start_codon:yes stop_codon:yes gene_type:complete